MSVQNNLHILATSADLSDDEVAALWIEAQEQAVNSTGSVCLPEFRELAEKNMVRLIEGKATANVPAQMIPWVLFDLHVGLLIVSTGNAIKNAFANARDYFVGSRGKQAA